MPSDTRLSGGAVSHAVIGILNTFIGEGKAISRRQAAQMIGKSHTYLNNRLNEDVDFTVTDLDSICRAIDIDLALLVAAAEWAVTKRRPKILTDDEAYTISQWFDLAAKDGWDFQREAEQQADYARATPRTGEV